MNNHPLIAGLAIILLGVPIGMQLREQQLHPQVVLQDNGAPSPNGCVVTACLATQKHPHSCVVLVRYLNSTQGHAYCLWLEHGKFYASDWRGTVALHLTKNQVAGVADALPVPEEGLLVESAELMKPSKL